MLHLLLPVLLALPLPAQDPPADEAPPQGESAEQQAAEELTPEQAVELLEAALKSEELDLIFIAVRDAGHVADKKVAKLLGEVAEFDDPEVRLEGLKALRYNEHEECLDELLKLKREEEILEDEVLAEAYYMALGQKRDKKAIKILADGLVTTNRRDKATRARILALGRIRDEESVEELMSLLVSGRARRAHPHMLEIHTALTVLTGAQVKPRQDDWIAWWNDHGDDLEITKQEQALSTRKARAEWMKLWATEEDKELMALALERGIDVFGDATPEELDELRKIAQERKEKAEQRKREKAEQDEAEKDGAGGDGEDPGPQPDGGDGR